ncbi:hypothetical protein JCM10207_007645 [Rhodosporidiobolus poonsookiae]
MMARSTTPAGRSRPRPSALRLVLLVACLLLAVSPALAIPSFSSSTSMSFCSCRCFSNSTIIPLYRPANPSNPCLSCTRQFCLDQKLPQCVGAQNPEEDPDTATGEGGDVEARCFQRDSPKSHFIVISFLVVTGILLVLAVLKQYGLDLPAIFAQSGVRGTLQEVVQFAQSLADRRRGRSRGGASYAAMG